MKFSPLPKKIEAIFLIGCLLVTNLEISSWAASGSPQKSNANNQTIRGSAILAVSQIVQLVLLSDISNGTLSQSLGIGQSLIRPGGTINIETKISARQYAVDPNVFAFLQRAQGIYIGSKPPEITPVHPGVIGLPGKYMDIARQDALSRILIASQLSQSLASFKVADIERMPIEELDSIAGQVWERKANKMGTPSIQGVGITGMPSVMDSYRSPPGFNQRQGQVDRSASSGRRDLLVQGQIVLPAPFNAKLKSRLFSLIEGIQKNGLPKVVKYFVLIPAALVILNMGLEYSLLHNVTQLFIFSDHYRDAIPAFNLFKQLYPHISPHSLHLISNDYELILPQSMYLNMPVQQEVLQMPIHKLPLDQLQELPHMCIHYFPAVVSATKIVGSALTALIYGLAYSQIQVRIAHGIHRNFLYIATMLMFAGVALNISDLLRLHGILDYIQFFDISLDIGLLSPGDVLFDIGFPMIIASLISVVPKSISESKRSQ